MKHAKKFASLLLALVMVLSLATTAFAATVTVPSEGILQGHTFTAYQVFTGREENGILSDVQWGNGINASEFMAALKADAGYGTKFTNCTTAADVAQVLGDEGEATKIALANRVAELAYTHKNGSGIALTSGENDLADGYYLVVDTTANVGQGGAYNKALLQVVGNINITVKTDAPAVEKKVKEDDKYNQNGDYGTGYNDVADYNIGESVPFHLIGTVPDMSRYDTYKYIFHDTLSAGLTSPAKESIKVYLSSDKVRDDNDTDITNHFEITVSGQEITVSCTNLKEITNVTQGPYIIVEYSAVLNTNAAIGLDGNMNTVKLEYSNKPDQSGSGDTDNTGVTPEDKVIVFTYELDTTKVDGLDSNKKLKDAKFVLLNSDQTKVAMIVDGKFNSWVEIPADGEDGKITWPEDSILTSAETTGLFTVTGLDDGTYRLREIHAPSGYNMLSEDVIVTITATTANGQEWNQQASTALTNLSVKSKNGTNGNDVDGNANVNEGKTSITIANNAGSTLPETGGIGTTIFYVLGGVLVLVAVVLLTTKKRMSGAEQ